MALGDGQLDRLFLQEVRWLDLRFTLTGRACALPSSNRVVVLVPFFVILLVV
jgi:hypothetical protein